MGKLKLLALAAAVSVNFACQAQQAVASQWFDKVKVDGMVSLTPNFNAGSVVNIAVPPREWVLLHVTYVPKAKKDQTGNFLWTDDMSIEFQVILNNDNKAYSLLTSKFDYWAVQLDGKEHHALALVPPTILERYTGKSRFQKGDVNKMPVKVSFFVNGGMVNVVYPDNDFAKTFMAAATSTTIRRIEGAVLNRDETPWSVLNFDAFDLIKKKR